MKIKYRGDSMTKLLEDAFNPELFRKNGHRLIDLLADYLSTAKQGKDIPVLPWRAPEELVAKWNTDFSQSTNSTDSKNFKLGEFCSALIADSNHLHHPGYMGHQVGVPVPAAALMEMVSAFLNNSMAVYEVGPLSSAMEKIVVRWLCSALGMDKNAGGVLTSGGSIGNLTGLLAARQHKAQYDIWEEGFKPGNQLAVMVSSESHYSIARAVKIMGWGEQGIVPIPVNRRLEIDAGALEGTYQRAIEQGKQVVAVVANACSTSTGSYDPLEEIAAFCKENKLWFHVDAAHGGGAVLTSKYKHLVKGIDKADSVVIDFHKMLLCPSLTTAIVFKQGKNAYETFSQNAAYLLNQQKRDNWWDIARRTLECTKKMMSIKIYALLKMYGVQLFDDYITKTYDLAKEFAREIDKAADFELALEPDSNIVCFRYAPAGTDPSALDELNSRLREELKEEGEFYIVRTEIGGEVFLRTTLMNPFTSMDHLRRLLHRVRREKKL
jgi:L-2,4-diaminobutyrate decarboxylase